MKLLYITNGISGIGGLERVLSIKASYFAENLGYEVHIICLNDKSSKPFYTFSPLIKFYDVRTVGKGICYLISYMKEINRVVQQVQPDIISVCDDGFKGLYVPLWIKKGKAAIIYERHASLRLTGGKLIQRLMSLGGYLYDKVVVLTHYNLSEWFSSNLVVIPNPLSFVPQQVSQLNQKKAICVGSISYNKGYDLLIEAWVQVSKKHPDWTVSIYGKGDTSDLQKLIDQKGLTKQIVFCGPTSNIQEKYLESSFLILPSRSEGFGMVLIEAMACGLPCISFDCPCGPRDIIRDGKNGYLVEPMNINLLAASINKAIEHKGLLRQMGKYAKESINQYEIEKVAACWHKLFCELKSS